MPKELSITGVFLGNASPDELKESHADIFTALESGELSPVVATEIPLKDAPESQDDSNERLHEVVGSAGNVVLVV